VRPVSDLVNRLVQARLPWISPRIKAWYDDQRLARQLAADLTAEAERVGNVDFGTGFRDAADADLEPDPLAWANRRIELADGGWAVAGIRFRALDRARPFVDIVATDQPATPDGLAAVAAAVLPDFEVFGPLCLRVDAPDPAGLVAALDADPRFGPSDVDQHVVAGQVSSLLKRRVASGDEVSLRPGEPDRLAERVAQIYAQHSEVSRQWATPEDVESLAECASQGLLFEVFVEDTPAGVVAAIREDGHGMSGFCVQELCLDAAFRGKGLAARAVHSLAQQLPAEPGDALWGTIHPDNLPSLRQALSLGREIVGGYVWVTPVDHPGMPGLPVPL
jgi:L-amino acid N-acyltransferase YncA